MTPLRAKIIRELELDRKSPRTIGPYVAAVAQLAKNYRRSPETISIEEIREFLHHLITVRKVAYSTCNRKLTGDPLLLPPRAGAAGLRAAGASPAD